jgi:hypothetical protein
MSSESVRVSESVTIIKQNPVKESGSMSHDNAKWTSRIKLEKYNTPGSYEKGVPDEVLNIEGNTALLVGLNMLWKLANGQNESDGAYPFNTANTFVGVGDSAATADANQGGLLGTNVAYAGMDTDAGIFPTISNNTMTVRAKFGVSEANFPWNEWGVLNGNPNDLGNRDAGTVVQFNRKVEAMGTKIEGSTWVIVAELTINP